MIYDKDDQYTYLCHFCSGVIGFKSKSYIKNLIDIYCTPCATNNDMRVVKSCYDLLNDEWVKTAAFIYTKKESSLYFDITNNETYFKCDLFQDGILVKDVIPSNAFQKLKFYYNLHYSFQ